MELYVVAVLTTPEELAAAELLADCIGSQNIPVEGLKVTLAHDAFSQTSLGRHRETFMSPGWPINIAFQTLNPSW